MDKLSALSLFLDVYAVADIVFATLQPGNEWHNCYSDEHYLPTLFNVSIQKLLNELFSLSLSLWLAKTILFKGKTTE